MSKTIELAEGPDKYDLATALFDVTRTIVFVTIKQDVLIVKVKTVSAIDDAKTNWSIKGSVCQINGGPVNNKDFEAAYHIGRGTGWIKY